MKKSIFCLMIYSVFLNLNVKAQPSNLPINHATIDSVSALYKPVQSAVDASQNSGIPEIKVISETIISLKSNGAVSKVYLKIFDKLHATELYAINYSTNSAIVKNAEGLVLFFNDGNNVHVTCPNVRLLDLYTYDITTEDASGKLSEVYSVTK